MRQLYRQGVVCQLMDASELADDDLVAVVSNMGAPLVGQERLTDPKTMALAVTMMEEYLGRKFRAVMSLEIGGGNSIQPFMAAAMLDLPVIDGDCMGRAFPEAQMTSFAIHDLQDVPADPRRRARQRGGGGARGELEVDGAHQPQGLRGGRLHRLHLQGPAHRQGDQGVRDPRLHHQGHRHRPGRAGRAAGPPRSDRRGARGRGRHQDLQPARSTTSPGGPPRASSAAPRRSRASTTSAATPSRSPSRTSSRWAGSTASRGS